jgi:hypothetical protein
VYPSNIIPDRKTAD